MEYESLSSEVDVGAMLLEADPDEAVVTSSDVRINIMEHASCYTYQNANEAYFIQHGDVSSPYSHAATTALPRINTGTYCLCGRRQHRKGCSVVRCIK
jgi:hypothetical protein